MAEDNKTKEHSLAVRHALDYEEVEVGGELRTRLERSFKRMHDKRYTEKELFTESADATWPGDFEGRTGLALVLDARALGIEEPEIDSLMGAFERYYNEKGYFGTIYFPEQIDEQQLSGHGWTLRALCEYYLWRKKPETLAQISRMVENLILPTKGLHTVYPLESGERANKGKASGHIVGTVSKWRLSADTGCDFIFFDGVVQAYAVTQDARLIPVIEEMVDLFGRMDLVGIKAQTHASMSGARAMVRWYELCGKPEVLARAEEVLDIYIREGCTENYENYNWFGRPDWTEPCAIIDSYLLATQLWQHTGKSRYLEAAQQIYFNGICATQRFNGGWGLNNCSGSSHAFLASITPEAYWCCSMRGAEGVASAARYSAFKDNTGIWIATFMDNKIEVPFGSKTFKLKQESDYPLSETTRLTVQSAPKKDFEVRLFTPSYLTPKEIRVNSEKVDYTIVKGFAVVKRRWKAGDVLEYDFRARLLRQPLRNQHSIKDYDLIRLGPLLLSARSKKQSPDKKIPPPEIQFSGGLKAAGPGKALLGDIELLPVYHLLDPKYDNLVGSWRQMLFPRDKSIKLDSFKKALPCWPETGEDDLNRRVGFRVVLNELPGDSVLRIATSGLYRSTVDGRFVGHGPARGGHGYFRIDEWPLASFAGDGPQVIGIEVAACQARSYYMIKQPTFLQAEIVSGGKVIAATPDFQAVDLHPVVVRKVPRYSYQRTFTEVFRPTPDWSAAWRNDPAWKGALMPLFQTPPVFLVPRGVPYPEFKVIEPKNIATGKFRFEKWPLERSYYSFNPKGFGEFPEEELEARPDRLMSSIEVSKLTPGEGSSLIKKNTFLLQDLGTNLSGFLGFKVQAAKPARLLATFDELRTEWEESVDPHRMKCINAILIELPAGSYTFETLEPYTLRYMQLNALDSDVTVERSYLRELTHPHAGRASFSCSDPRLETIFEAARQTFRQNATDIFMDCPSRERSGWLCDSFFTSRVEATLTGASAVERNFLENYAQPETFPGLVSGMLPACYPSDPYMGSYIPNWAMWFVIQLEEYGSRTGDREFIERLLPKVEELFDFFTRFENADGLLEKLEEWVFVEWSEANKFVQDINYPTNMLYAAAIDAASRIYKRKDWKRKARALREVINEQSFDGTFYRDHAKRLPDGKLDTRPERTEVCQYYAFFFKTATPESRPELWKLLVEEFGPARSESKAHPEIFPCNQLPGNMLRIEILSRNGETARIHDEALGYWHKMATITGTLWEHDKPQASCNHGFASHAAVVLRRDILGLRDIDYRNKTVKFSVPDNPLSYCSGSFPTPEGEIVVSWKRGDEPEISLPKKWSLK